MELKELPEYSIVKSKTIEADLNAKSTADFVKLGDTWTELWPHCAECATTAQEGGAKESDVRDYNGISFTTSAEEYIGEFELLARGETK